LKEGTWFPGGAVALIRGQKALDKLEGANEDQTVGIRILSRSIEEPAASDRRRTLAKMRPWC
jgi:chaperonin GroEL (HSP60 family)